MGSYRVSKVHRDYMGFYGVSWGHFGSFGVKWVSGHLRDP